MIGESGGITSLVYQEQVARESQIQKDQAARQETEGQGRRQESADVTSFSSEGLELARTAVTGTQATPEAEMQEKPQEGVVIPQRQASSSSFAQHLDIQA